ncbi:L,D-transpeptidase [Patescibacteria group bacterium]|nr:L,D-transpeptidase [Patescibacteria group bacterium]MCL5409884.1 L,D-transpeptidase [Patescibacteria group bacterium]
MYRFLPVVAVILIVVTFLCYLPFRAQILYTLKLTSDPTTSCCDVNQVLQSDGSFDENASVAIFDDQIIDYPKTSLSEQYLAENQNNTNVLGDQTPSSSRWIEVSLQEQKLRAWDGNQLVMEFPISSGLWYPTPKGTFTIWYKTKSQRMVGGSKALGTFYDLPNVPNNMFFYQGYALHGAYWHNNFGHPMSHGCVNEPLVNAAELFNWAGPVLPPGKNTVLATTDNPGTRVYIH